MIELTKRERLRLARQRLAWHEQTLAQDLRGAETWGNLAMVRGNKGMVALKQKSAREQTAIVMALRYWLSAGCPVDRRAMGGEGPAPSQSETKCDG